MDEGRPIPLLVAVVVVGLLGVGGLTAAPLLLAQAASAQQLDDHLGAIGGAMLFIAGVATLALGSAGTLGAVGIWKRRSWGWLVGALASAVVLLGTVVAMSFADAATPLVLGAVLGGAGAIAVWWPATRRACGI